MAKNPFKKMSDDWKKGWQKMQDNFNQFFHITPANQPQADLTIANSSTSIDNSSIPSSSSFSSSSSETFIYTKGSQSMVQNSESIIQSNWLTFMTNTQATFSKWQTDLNAFIKRSQEKLKARNEKWKTEWDANNKKMVDFFKKQQDDFNQKVKTMNEEMKQKNMDFKENTNKIMQAITGTWNNIVQNQKKEMDSFEKMQTRLWWKGYLNSMLWIMLFVIVLGGIMWILRYFGILDFIQTISTTTQP